MEGLPDGIQALIDTAIKLIQWAVPTLLIIFGGLDLGKAVMAGEEKEIKAAQKLLMKRAIAAVAVFLLSGIVQYVFNIIRPGGIDVPTL